jgi:hypothetical protein
MLKILRMQRLWTFGLKDSWCIYHLWILSFYEEEELKYNLTFVIFWVELYTKQYILDQYKVLRDPCGSLKNFLVNVGLGPRVRANGGVGLGMCA